MYQIDKQERHHLHHIALPKDLHWYNQQKGIFFAPGHENPAIEVQCHRWHLQTTDVQHAFFNFWAKFWESDPPPGGEFVDISPPSEWRIQPTCLLTLEGVQQAIKETDVHTAIGPDGWRLSEVQVLGPASIACFTQIFNHCIQGVQDWPHAFQWARCDACSLGKSLTRARSEMAGR